MTGLSECSPPQIRNRQKLSALAALSFAAYIIIINFLKMLFITCKRKCPELKSIILHLRYLALTLVRHFAGSICSCLP